MRILLVLATNIEADPIARSIGFSNYNYKSKFNSFKYKDLDIDILVTGVGISSTIYWTTKTLQKAQYDLALNLGIAGAYSIGSNIGDVYWVNEESFADFGFTDESVFKTAHENKLVKDNIPFHNSILRSQQEFQLNTLAHIPTAKGATVNTITGKQTIISDNYVPTIETMEGAAFFFVCLLEKIPFYEIRSISNYVEEKNRVHWNIPLAIESLTKFTVSVLNELNDIK